MRKVKTISESKDGKRKEVIAKDKDGDLVTRHIQYMGGWRYCTEKDKGGKCIKTKLMREQ